MNNKTTVLLGHSIVNTTVRKNTDSLQFDYLVCGDLTIEYIQVTQYGSIVCILRLNCEMNTDL